MNTIDAITTVVTDGNAVGAPEKKKAVRKTKTKKQQTEGAVATTTVAESNNPSEDLSFLPKIVTHPTTVILIPDDSCAPASDITSVDTDTTVGSTMVCETQNVFDCESNMIKDHSVDTLSGGDVIEVECAAVFDDMSP